MVRITHGEDAVQVRRAHEEGVFVVTVALQKLLGVFLVQHRNRIVDLRSVNTHPQQLTNQRLYRAFRPISIKSNKTVAYRVGASHDEFDHGNMHHLQAVGPPSSARLDTANIRQEPF